MTVVIVDGGGIGMEPMEPIGVDEGCGKDAIVTAAINPQCSRGWPPSLPLLMMNDYRWLLAVVIINCAAAVMIGGVVMVMAAAMATKTTIN